MLSPGERVGYVWPAGIPLRAIFFVALLPLLIACKDPPLQDPLQQIADTLLELTGLDREAIAVNPAAVVALRTPRTHDRILPAGVGCAVQTSDGKHIAVRETCEQVRQRLDAAK